MDIYFSFTVISVYVGQIRTPEIPLVNIHLYACVNCKILLINIYLRLNFLCTYVK